MHTQFWQMCLVVSLLTMLSGILGLPRHSPAHGVEVPCAAGDVACLIDAIDQANATGAATTITLEAGTYTLTGVNNTTDGPNGLPSVTGIITLQGAGADASILERGAGAPNFRLVHVATPGTLILEGLTLRRGSGSGSGSGSGGGLVNNGRLTITHSTIADNFAETGGSGLANSGTASITHSTIADNIGTRGGGGLVNNGRLTITHSTIADNLSAFSRGGGLVNNGRLTITHSTIADNFAEAGGGLGNSGRLTITHSTIARNGGFGTPGGGAGIQNSGALIIINSTISRNGSVFGPGGLDNFSGTVTITNSTIANNGERQGVTTGGILNARGTVALQNTILARNTSGLGDSTSSDCSGPVTSLGHNLVGDPTDCTIDLQPTDFTGDPGLGAFTDDGTPGHGHVPLLPGSPAIDAGDDAVCPRRDQLGQRRDGPCDMGSVEFQDRDDRHHSQEPPPFGKGPLVVSEGWHPFRTEAECQAALARKLDTIDRMMAHQAVGQVHMSREPNGVTQHLLQLRVRMRLFCHRHEDPPF